MWPRPRPEIPPSFVGQNVCVPETYLEQLGTSFQVPAPQAPQVYHDPNILAQGALGIFDPNTNRIGFPTTTIYEIVAYHEYLHFLGQLRYNDPLAIQREEHEVYQFHVGPEANPTWCLTCRKSKFSLRRCSRCGHTTPATGLFCDQCGEKL